VIKALAIPHHPSIREYRSMPPMQRYLTSRNSSMPYFEPQ
jgi:hypothetical protein